MRELVKIAKALSDETRVRMLKLLLEKDICVREMQETLNISQPQVSRHLKILMDAGFLKCWREGKCIAYYAERDSNNIFTNVLLEALSKSFNDNPAVTQDREKLQEALALLIRERVR